MRCKQSEWQRYIQIIKRGLYGFNERRRFGTEVNGMCDTRVDDKSRKNTNNKICYSDNNTNPPGVEPKQFVYSTWG